VSELTTNRLSVYLRCLNTPEAGPRDLSQALAEQFHLNAAQIRKDSHFGEFGVRGVG
jgi:NADH/NAD ratio-sensing transcriptional regulator Rex